MRLAIALLAAALSAQEVQEVRIKAAGSELSYRYSSPDPKQRSPLLVVLPGGGAKPESLAEIFRPWRTMAGDRGWHAILPMVPGGVDGGVKALEAILADARQRLSVDDSRVYLVGAGPAASEVFYAISRVPDLWTAAVAVEGNPAAAVNSNRLFAANMHATPVRPTPPSSQPARVPSHSAPQVVQNLLPTFTEGRKPCLMASCLCKCTG